MRRVVRVLAFAAILTLAVGACGSDKDTGLGAGPTEAPVARECPTPIEMNDALQFVPATCAAKVGETVTWETVGSAPHTVTARDEKLFDSGATDLVATGEQFEFTFTAVGEYPYTCRVHVGMDGTITVEAA